MEYLRSFPLGHPIVESPHSVCVSLPTMRDVIGYEEKDPAVLGAMRSGYPRFYRSSMLQNLVGYLKSAYELPPGEVFLTTSSDYSKSLIDFVGSVPVFNQSLLGFEVVVYPAQSGEAGRARAYQQHVGCAPSSRCAEDALISDGRIERAFVEDTLMLDEGGVTNQLDPIIGESASVRTFLTQGGMNAFHSTHRAIGQVMRPRGRARWVQLGWLYVDTIEIVRKFSPENMPPVIWHDVNDLDGLERSLEPIADEISAIVTEVPTNPLIMAPDIDRLRQLADRLGCLLVLDPSVASIANVDLLPFADVLVTSLTKYTARKGDVMIGAASVNCDRPFAEELIAGIDRFRLPPFERDVQRFGSELGGWNAFTQTAGVSASKVAEFLERHPMIKKVWWDHSNANLRNYARIKRASGGPGAVLTFTLKKPLADFYDAVDLVKSPSFGTEFTLLSPYMYLAHYDTVSKPEGRKFLEACGLSPELIRLSIGSEPADEICDRLDRALRK